MLDNWKHQFYIMHFMLSLYIKQFCVIKILILNYARIR
jgi:hypothetical protein